MTESTDIRYYLAALRRRVWVIVGIAVLVAAAAGVLSLLQQKTYEARAEVLLGGNSSAQVASLGSAAARNVSTEVQVFESPAVRNAATAKLGHVPSVSIEAQTDAGVVDVVASSPDPDRAARDANAYAEAYVAYRLKTTIETLTRAGQQLQQQIADLDAQIAALPAGAQRSALESQRVYLYGQQNQLQVAQGLADFGSPTVLAEAGVPGSPASPNVKRNVLLGLVLGLVLGIALALLLEYFDDTITSRNDLDRALAGVAPVLAEVPAWNAKKKIREFELAVFDDPGSFVAETFGILRTSLTFLGIEKPMTTIQVTSAVAGEGKTTVVANLAASLAKAGKRVIVIDLDLRRPQMHRYFNLDNSVGFTTVMLEDVTPMAAIRRVSDEVVLGLMPSGRTPQNPAELLASPKVPDLLQAVASTADVVIVDSPPVLPVADALTIAGLVDKVLLVVRNGKSSRRAMRRALEMLNGVGADLMGVVLNAVEPESFGYGYGYGRYAYRSRTDKESARSGNGSSSATATEG